MTTLQRRIANHTLGVAVLVAMIIIRETMRIGTFSDIHDMLAREKMTLLPAFVNVKRNGSNSTFEALPRLLRNESFGACLMVKGDNDLLVEWLAYHYTVLPLRFLLIASDTGNAEDPYEILQRWKFANTGLSFELINVSVFENIHGPFKYNDKQELEIFNIERKKKSLEPVNDITDKEAQARKAHHLLKYKQKGLISYCVDHMKARGVQWISLHDTDEFLSINYIDIDEIGRYNNNRSILGEKYGVRKDLPSANSNATVFDIINSWKNTALERPACPVIPRVTFGASEEFHCLQSITTIKLAKEYNVSGLNTLRYHSHAHEDRIDQNGIGKVFLDISRFPNDTLARPPNNIHRPFTDSCPRPFASVQYSPFYLMHFTGGWERFEAKGDKRRDYTEWKKRGHIKDSNQCCSQENHMWLLRFIEQVGLERAKYLLQGITH